MLHELFYLVSVQLHYTIGEEKEELDPARKMKGTLTVQAEVKEGDTVEIQCGNIIWTIDTKNIEYVSDASTEIETENDQAKESTLFNNKSIQKMTQDEQYEVMTLAGSYGKENSKSYVSLSIYSTFDEGDIVGTVDADISNEQGITMYRFIDEPIYHIKGGEFCMYQSDQTIYFTFKKKNGTYTLNVKGPDADLDLIMTSQYSS